MTIENFLGPNLRASEWAVELESAMSVESFQRLSSFLKTEYSTKRVFPPAEDIFTAFNLTDFSDVRVVILGQDPYHGAGQAHGLAFSVHKGIKPLPPSLKNIFKEQNNSSLHGDLTHWADQGVFLLNTVLTVEEKKAHSHKGQGWEVFTDEVIKILSEKKEKLIFLLWGAPAQAKKALIDEERHIVLEAPHPSPLSAYRGFLGCGHFDEVNRILRERGEEEILWEATFELF